MKSNECMSFFAASTAHYSSPHSAVEGSGGSKRWRRRSDNGSRVGGQGNQRGQSGVCGGGWVRFGAGYDADHTLLRYVLCCVATRPEKAGELSCTCPGKPKSL